MDECSKDPRFAHIPSDPKFRRIPKSEKKIKIDKAFRSLLQGKKRNLKYTIDKRGRPINQSSSENLKKFYDLDSDDSNDTDENEQNKEKSENTEKNKLKKSKKVKKIQSLKSDKPGKFVKKNDASQQLEKDDDNDDNPENFSEDSSASEDSKSADIDFDENERQLHIRGRNECKKIQPEIKQKLRDLTVDYARGEGTIFSDSSSDEDSTTDDEEVGDIEHNWGELDKDSERTEEITSRLAACNMDWDRIRAVDIMIVLNSFLPPGGLIHSVTIYPSEFGLQRMKEEEVKGPIELVDNKIENNNSNDENDDNNDDDDEEGSAYHMEKMRQYQLNRLKYYYAVVVFDSKESANKVYTECDGLEYETTATKLDLRFIPEDMKFDQEPKEYCDKLPELPKYTPRRFTTTALQQVNVKLTWDETNPERQEIAEKLSSGKIDEIDANQLRAFVASGSSDEGSENDENNEHDDESTSEMDKGKSKDSVEKYRMLLKEKIETEEEKKKNEIELECSWGVGKKEKTENLIKERLKNTESLTPFEKYLEKRKEKKLAKKEKRKNLSGEIIGSSDSEDSIPSDIDMNDPYFAEELKKTKSKKEKKNKNHKNSINCEDDEKEKQSRAELELLLLNDNEEQEKQHFNMKTIEENEMLSKSKKKRLNKKKKIQKESAVEDTFKIDVHDPRFAAFYTSHEYNIDPASPHYRKTKGTEALINEKLKRRMNTDNNEETSMKKVKSDGKLSDDLAALVKTVKTNTKNISKPIK